MIHQRRARRPSRRAHPLPSPTVPVGGSSTKNRAQAIAAAIALLAELYPKCFAIYEERRRPLKIGIHQDIQAALDGAITPTELHRALGFYCSNPVYLSQTRTGAGRVDLNGELAGAVTADEEAHAKATLAGIKRKNEARAAATRAQPPPPKRLSLSDLKAAALARKSDINTESHGRK
jgi:ProP effector